MTLKYLTIKPTELCPARCSYCESRRALLKTDRKDALHEEDWKRVITQSRQLGATYIDVSGGEPLMYRGLGDIVIHAKKLGMYVSLNSTGTSFSSRKDELEASCLDKICISLISLDRETNNSARGSERIYDNTMQAISLIKQTKIALSLHFILCKKNFRHVPEIIRFSFDCGAASLALAYPENDHITRNLLLTDDEINDYLVNIAPEASDVYDTLKITNQDLPKMFLGNGIDATYSEGLYWRKSNDAISACDKPNNFILIYPNGDAYPCNGAEYMHGPIIGNVRTSSISEIWSGEKMDHFRKTRDRYCNFCPIKRHVGIPIAREFIPPYSCDHVISIPNSLVLADQQNEQVAK
jgi:pyrroloquinoline quinone biosynthesis protein E